MHNTHTHKQLHYKADYVVLKSFQQDIECYEETDLIKEYLRSFI